MNFDEFLKRISKIKNIPLPAESSQFKMAPSFRQGVLENQQEVTKNAKSAGVLAFFYPDQDRETHFILILRNTYKGVHSAQVGFPGGKREAQDTSLQDTAVRETFEEIGVPIADMEIVCPLSQIYIPPSNFYVHPFMAISKTTPHFIRQEDEVESILEIPLQQFFDDNFTIREIVSTSYHVDAEVPAYKLNNHIVWGATAMMLSEIKDLLKELM
ncbi:NUDIX hydrolase [Mariniflexile ostreae]|uniref:NUDIX hydrolase n=1 Tax=Mariniflexile ostreae TaxID=1520892 RepID=A0ABV5FAB8_9FLAO